MSVLVAVAAEGQGEWPVWGQVLFVALWVLAAIYIPLLLIAAGFAVLLGWGG